VSKISGSPFAAVWRGRRREFGGFGVFERLHPKIKENE
jgi:hypothetical protein